MPSTGQARFKTTYTAVVFKPFKGEVMDGKVSNVNKVSLDFFFWLRLDIADPSDGLLCHGRTSSGLCIITCKWPSPLLPPILPSHSFRDEPFA